MLQGAPTDVEVNLTPEEVEGLDEAALKALYEDKVAEVRETTERRDPVILCFQFHLPFPISPNVWNCNVC